MVINGINVTLTGNISTEELTVYLTQLQAKSKGKIVSASVIVDGEFIDFTTIIEPLNFERIRRITGYLVGTTARWGNAKQAELKDRVKHG